MAFVWYYMIQLDHDRSIEKAKGLFRPVSRYERLFCFGRAASPAAFAW